MAFNDTFNNISVISWWSVLLVEETGGPGEIHRPDTCRKSLSISKNHQEYDISKNHQEYDGDLVCLGHINVT